MPTITDSVSPHTKTTQGTAGLFSGFGILGTGPAITGKESDWRSLAIFLHVPKAKNSPKRSQSQQDMLALSVARYASDPIRLNAERAEDAED